MKFSNIACVALLGATLTTSAFAAATNLKDSGEAYDNSVAQYQFFNKLQDDLKALKGTDIIATGATSSAADLKTTNTKFEDLLKDMFKFGSDVVFGTTGVVLDNLGTGTYKITLKGTGTNKGLTSIEISDSGDSKVDTITLTDSGVLQIKQASGGGIISDTAGLAKEVVDGILDALGPKAAEKVDDKAGTYLTALTALDDSSTPGTNDIPMLTDTFNNQVTMQLLKDNLAAVAIKAAKEAGASATAEQLKAANDALKASGKTIKVGDKTYNGSSAPLTKDMITNVQNTDTVGVLKISEAQGANVAAAQGYLDSYNALIEADTINKALKTSATDVTTGVQQTALKGTVGTNPFKDDAGLKKAFGLGEKDTFDASKVTVIQLAKFAEKLNKIKADLEKAKDMPNSTDAQKTDKLNKEKEALKDAIAAGLQFDKASSQSAALTDSGVDSLTNADSGDGSAVQAVTNALSLFGNSTALGKLLGSVSNLEKGYVARANAIGNYNANIASTENTQAANALGTIPTNELATDMLINANTSDIVATVKNITKSTNYVASALSTKTLDVLRNSDNLSTSTRLAMLSNPYSANLGLASAIDKLNSNNDLFASMDNGSLSSVIKEYTTRFENDANVWANVVGGKGVVKEGMNSTLFGSSIGYDKRLDNTILGGFFSYAKSRASADLSSVKADNYELGAYGRTFINNHEIDYKASIGIGKAKSLRNFIVASKNTVSSQEGSFNTTFANLAVDYGYVINMGESMFVKPLVGIDYNYAKSGEFDENMGNNIAQHFGSVKNSILSAKLGAEFRKYLSSGNYFYATPAISSELYKSKQNLKVNYVGSAYKIDVPLDNKKGTYFVLDTGLDLKVTDKLSTNISFGTKLGSKAQYYNGTFGLRYAF